MFIYTPKITDEEWTILPTNPAEAEYYRNYLSSAWFENDNLLPVKKEFDKGRKLAMMRLTVSGGMFRKIHDSIESDNGPLLLKYDFPFSNLTDIYFARADRQTVFQHTLKIYNPNPSFAPSLLLNHCILTPTFGVIRDEVPIQDDLASKLVEKYSEINVTINDPNIGPARSVTRPNCNLSSIKQSLDSARAAVEEIEKRKKCISESLFKVIPDSDKPLYDGIIRDFESSYLVDIELLIGSNSPEKSDLTKILLSTSMSTLTPMFSGLWRIDKHHNIRLTDIIDLVTHNANLISQLSPIRLTDIGSCDDLTWYSNLGTLYTLQSQSSLALFYNKMISNLDAKLKNQRGIPTPIPYPALEPRK